MRISAQIEGIDKVGRELEKYVASKSREIEKEVERSARNIQSGARKRAPVNFGFLRSGIVVRGELRNTLTTLLAGKGFSREVAATKEYSAPVEFGSKPHWAPIRPLKLWAKRVLGDESLAYAVQKAIAERGTKEQPFLFPAFEEERPKFVERLTSILRDG